MIKRAVTEAELRLYGFCSKLYELDAFVEFRNEMQIACKQMIEKFILYQLKNGSKAFYDEVVPAFITNSIDSAYSNIQNPSELMGQKEIANKRLKAWFNDYINKFKPYEYEVVIGPYLPNVRISKTSIELDISGILYHSQTNTIHILTWMNDVRIMDPQWDLPSLCKFVFGKKYTENKKVVIHFLDINHRNTYSKEICMYIKTIDETDIEDEHYLFLKQKINEFEKRSNYHRIPYCIFMDCPKRKECQK